MNIPPLHDWNVPCAEARRIQQELAGRVTAAPLPETIHLVAGADVAVARGETLVFAAVVVLSWPGMECVEAQSACAEARFPYVPGLLSFREGPAVLAAMQKLARRPDVVMFDGQGIAHPRRLGLAAHMGLWLGLPTVGCAKSRLIGEHAEPGRERGAWTPLTDRGEVIGSVLRTRAGIKPLFVSPGHLCDQEGARRLVLACALRYRLPEPTRQAHRLVGELRATARAERPRRHSEG